MIHFDRAYQSPTKARRSPYQSSIKLNAPLSRTATHAHLLHLLAYPHPLDSPIHSHAIIYSNLPRGELKNNQWCPLACSHPLAFAHLLAYPHPLASPIHSHALIYSNMPRGELKNNQWCPLACSHPLACAHLLAYPHPLESPIHSHALIYSNLPRGGIKN